jgi:RHS repeat-associated protein
VLRRERIPTAAIRLERTLGYTGHVMDAQTGQIYQQQRYMDPLLGVFTSVDPVTAYGTGDWRLFTRYAYAFNNPYKFTDPDGRAAETAWDAINVGIGVASFIDNARSGNWGAAAVDALGVAVDSAATVVPFVPGGAGTGIRIARGLDNAADTSKGADFIVTKDGTAVPTSQPRMTEGLEAAGMQGTPLPNGKGTSYTLPDGTLVRAMEPSGPAPRRASFSNSGGGPVTPDGTVPQPPRGSTPAERRKYVRDRTHVEQTK